MARTKSRFPEKNLNQKITFNINSDDADFVERRIDELHISKSDYFRNLIHKDYEERTKERGYH